MAEANGKDGRRRVVVTGMGAVSPVGLTLEENWRNILDGVPGADYITLFDARGGGFPTQFACEVKGFDPSRESGRRRPAEWTA